MPIPLSFATFSPFQLAELKQKISRGGENCYIFFKILCLSKVVHLLILSLVKIFYEKSFKTMKRCNPSNGRECGNTKLHEQVIFISTIFIHTVHKGNLQCRIKQKQSQQNKELVSGSQDNTTLFFLHHFCEVQSKESALLLHWVEFMVPSITLNIELSKKFSFPNEADNLCGRSVVAEQPNFGTSENSRWMIELSG